MGGLLTASEKNQMPSDIKNKHDDWGRDIIVKEIIASSEYRTSLSPVDTYAIKFTVKAIVHTLAQISKATTLNLSKEFIEEGYKNNVQYVAFVLLETLGSRTIDKNDKIEIDGEDFFIDSMVQYKHEILFTLKNENF